MQFEIGEPNHGWLPIKLWYKGFELDLIVSDVPLDPIVQLCDALLMIFMGGTKPDKIVWHLEPFCYYLQLEKLDTNFKATVFESDYLESPLRLVKEIEGDFEAMIMPLSTALKKFSLCGYSSPHWEELDQVRLNKLKRLIENHQK